VIYPELDNIDLSGTFGSGVGGIITKFVSVTDGSIDISFIHGVENPLINGIEILGAGSSNIPIQVSPIANQTNTIGDVLNGNLKVSASGGEGNLSYSITGAPQGVIMNSASGVISGTINQNAYVSSPYSVSVTVDDSDGKTNDAVTVSFIWIMNIVANNLWVSKDENENYTARHECSFVQAGDKFYLMGGRENAKTIDIYNYASNSWTSLINSAPFEFNHYQAVEYQGLIWIIGAFKTNNYPSETPADNIWIFNPKSQEWIEGPEIPINRRRGSTGLSVYKDKFYIVGGNTNGHDGGFVSWMDEYDPATGIWTSMPNAPRSRDHFNTAVIGDKLYAVGGRLSGGTGGVFNPVIAEVDVYNFSSASWSTLSTAGNLPTPRAAASVVNFKDKLLVIGGEVNSEPVYGITTTGALKITEEFNPVTGAWKRIEDLNFKRHGTQAIVSGNGVFTLAGSPNLGGGSQKNMEYLGQDSPQGIPAVISNISAPNLVSITVDNPSQIPMQVVNGNMGVFISSVVLSGPDKDKFQIISGSLNKTMLKSNSSQIIVIKYTGSIENAGATLVINQGASQSTTIELIGKLGGVKLTAVQVATLNSKIEEVEISDIATYTIKLFPNPAKFEIFLQVSDPNLEIMGIGMYDNNGRFLKDYYLGSELIDLGSGKYQFNKFGWPAGIYILKIITNVNHIFTHRLIIEN